VSRDALDRRAVQLRILPAGSRILRRTPVPFAGVLPDALASLDQRTLKRIEADLARLLTKLQVSADSAGVPLANL